MKLHILVSLAGCWLLAVLIVPLAHFALAQAPHARQDAEITKATGEAARSTIPAVPREASYDHRIRLHVIKVTPIEQIDETQILKLEVERFYGKIDTVSANRAQKHETQRFTVLFPASLDADIRPGDIIDYGLIGYLAIGRK